MRILRVGDPHIRPSNLEEAERLMGFVKQVIIGSKAGQPIDRLEILGDLFHTHAVIRLEVLLFWNKWIPVFKDVIETVILVGNHDMSGNHNSDGHALTVFKGLQDGRLKIIDRPTRIGIYGYAPYSHEERSFQENASRLSTDGARVLVCHATFSGSKFDNGFYAPEGIDPETVPFETIISGHIHKQQIFANGKVDYPGTPKWDSASDANESKGIWLYEHDDVTGKVINRDLISTAHVCTPIIEVVWHEGQDEPVIPEGSRATIELIGSSAWIAKKKSAMKGKTMIRSKSTDQKRSATRKAGNSLENFLLNTYDTKMDRLILMQFAKGLGIVAA